MSGVLYRAFDEDGRLLYVGITIDEFQRLLGDHTLTAKWLDHTARIDIVRYPSREESADVERIAIRTEGPVFNRNGRSRRVWFAALVDYVGEQEATRLADRDVWAWPVTWGLSPDDADRVYAARRTRMWKLLYPNTCRAAPAA